MSTYYMTADENTRLDREYIQSVLNKARRDRSQAVWAILTRRFGRRHEAPSDLLSFSAF